MFLARKCRRIFADAIVLAGYPTPGLTISAAVMTNRDHASVLRKQIVRIIYRVLNHTGCEQQ